MRRSAPRLDDGIDKVQTQNKARLLTLYVLFYFLSLLVLLISVVNKVSVEIFLSGTMLIAPFFLGYVEKTGGIHNLAIKWICGILVFFNTVVLSIAVATYFFLEVGKIDQVSVLKTKASNEVFLIEGIPFKTAVGVMFLWMIINVVIHYCCEHHKAKKRGKMET